MENLQELEDPTENNGSKNNGWSIQKKRQRKFLVDGNFQYPELQKGQILDISRPKHSKQNLWISYVKKAWDI